MNVLLLRVTAAAAAAGSGSEADGGARGEDTAIMLLYRTLIYRNWFTSFLKILEYYHAHF